MIRDFECQTASDFDVLLTAATSYPVLERAFLGARSEIWASFRVFDLSTRVCSAEARQVAETWFDLVVHTLARGVQLNIVISDFDPVARPALHRGTWRSVRQLVAAAELSGRPDRHRVVAGGIPLEPGSCRVFCSGR